MSRVTVAFYSIPGGRNSPAQPGGDLATLTRAPRPVHIAQEYRKNVLNGKERMRDEETQQSAGASVSSSRARAVDDPRVYLAAERTFLAWVRTAVSLMGFGFLIARFALFLRAYGMAPQATHGEPTAVSSWVGVGMICVGVAVCVVAASRHRAYIRALERGVANPPRDIRTSLLVATILALVGLAMAIHILTI
jgi:putative membrane protein